MMKDMSTELKADPPRPAPQGEEVPQHNGRVEHGDRGRRPAPALHGTREGRRRQDIAVVGGSEPVTAAGVQSDAGAGGKGRR
jgi:hypothetical protein